MLTSLESKQGCVFPGKVQALKSLQNLPGVGPSIAEDLWNLGIRCPESLELSDPDLLFENLCKKNGAVDRCVLYVFRCIVNYVKNKERDLEKLKWWNWQDYNYELEKAV